MPLAKRKTKSTAKQEPKRSAVKKSKPSVMKKSKPVKTKSKSSISRKSKPLIIKKSKPVIPTMLNPAILKKTKPSAPTMSTPSPVEKTKVPAQGRLTLSAVTRSKTLAVQTTKPLRKEKPKPVYIFSEMSTGEESELSIIERPKTSVSKKLSVSKKTTPTINKNLSARKKSRPLADADDVILTTKADFNFDIKNTGLFMQKWILLDKIPIIPHSSPVYRVVTKDGIYGDLRCFTKEEHPRLNMELMCLDKMEKQGNGHMFRKVCEMRMVNSEKDGFMTYVVTYHRPGIPLSNISSNTKILDAASGTRFGVEMIEIVENLAKAKILMKDISPDYFVIDQYSSKLFLSNASSLIGNAERFNINKNFAFPSWKGSFEHAPLRWHMEPGAPLTEGDVVESAFYVFLDMIGKLPWKSCEMIDIVDKKQKLNTSDMNLLRTSELPPSLITCMMIIRRGQMLDVCRTKDASSNTILLHKFREHGINGKPVPTAAMIEYGAIYTAMRTFGGIGNAFANLPLPASLTKPPPDPTRAALMDQLMRQKLERDALIIEIQALHKIVNARHIHTKQLEAEVKNNERFIAKYVYQAEDIRELKFEPHAAPMEETTNLMCPAAVMDEPPCFGHEYSLQEL